MHNILLIGRNSFLCREAFNALNNDADCNIRAISHGDLDLIRAETFDVAINFAFPPHLFQVATSADADFERWAINRLRDRVGHYIMLSSRMVYAAHDDRPTYCEDDPLKGRNVYGSNKLAEEIWAGEALGDRLTILRLSNVFGMEPDRHTFFGRALQTLRDEGRITLDFGVATVRDFLPAANFSRALARISTHPPSGIFNLGSGIATPVGNIANALIHGFGRGEVVATNPMEEGNYVLDMHRLTSLIGSFCDVSDVERSCFELGRALR